MAKFNKGEVIRIQGAREHNLKGVDIEIPRNQFVVMTGLSGSGKSSLAFDTIFAEGQRRYVESLSSYARQFLGVMQKPNVTSIEGLSPAISIDQKTTSKNPRSTVGTVTEIYDYIRLLYARIGVPYCPNCHTKIEKQSIDQIVEKVLELDEGTKIQVLSPAVRARKGKFVKQLEEYQKNGFVRARIDGEVLELSDDIKLILQAGPYVSYGLFSSDIDWSAGGKTKVLGDEYDRFDAGAIGGISLDLKLFTVGLEYSHGLKKLRPKEHIYDLPSGFNQTFSLVFSYKL